MKYGSARQALLDAGGRLLREKGYAGTGLSEILKTAGVPKGSFYHHFPSKDAFVLEILDRYIEEQRERIEAYLDRNDLSPVSRLRGFFEAEAERLRREGCRGGCLVGTLGQDQADQNPELRTKIEDTLGEWTGRFCSTLAQGTRTGEVPEGSDIRSLGDFIMNAWQGALLRMKTRKSARPLHQFIEMVFGRILPPQK